MSLLSSNKGKFVIIISVFAALIILATTLIVKIINSIGGTDNSQKPIKEVRFELKPSAATQKSKTGSLQEKTEVYRSAQEESTSKRTSKNISFSSVFKQPSQPDEKREQEGERKGAKTNSSSDITAMIEQEISRSTSRSSTPVQPAEPSRAKSPAVQQIETEIRKVYGNTPTSATSPSKEKSEEEKLIEQKKLMEQGFTSGTTGNAEELRQNLVGYIHGAQNVKNGDLIAIRLDTPFELDGKSIPRNTLIFADVQVSRNRANITVRSIKVNSSFIPVELYGYAPDGIAGLPITVSSTQKTISDNTSNAVGRTVDRAISSTPLGGVLGGLASSLTNSDKREKNITISFLENQKIYLSSTKPYR